MRVFLTGASGFIGSHVTRVLVAAGCEIAALVVPNDPLWRLQDIVSHLTIMQGDLSGVRTMRPLLAEWKPEISIHLAWYAEPGKYLGAPENISSLTNSLALLDELIGVGCQQIIMVGTCAEYDTDVGFLREDGPTRPTTLYAATKLALCLIGRQLAIAAGVKFAWGRIFYLYGPCEDERRIVPALIRALLSGEPFPATHGEQVRDYLHVEDVAAALWTLAEQRATGIFNISSGVPVTLRQVMETIGNVIGRTDLIRFGMLPYRNWDPRFICGDNQRLRAMGWRPRYSLQEGLRQTVEWWRK
jgi:nucleoside-diphosphate-sugar epimerase